MRAFLIEDSEGRIVGTVPAGVQTVRTSLPGSPVSGRETEEEEEKEELELEVVAEPLKGQRVWEVDLPPEFEKLEGAELLDALRHYRVATGEAKLLKRPL
jgi:hypothetical protein